VRIRLAPPRLEADVVSRETATSVLFVVGGGLILGLIFRLVVWLFVFAFVRDLDFMVPVGVHVAFVAVAKRSCTEGSLARAGWLENTWALLEGRWAEVLIVVVGTI